MDTPAPAATGFFRPKGYLDRTHLAALALLALTPFVLIVIRTTALPGVIGSGIDLDFVRSIGSTLNHTFSLTAIPPAERDRVLYLLLLPLSAMLIALARLTLGIRVLGFRSILISVGFQQSGFVPSLILITIVTGTIVLVRPRLREIRLPRYARISVILGIVVVTMLIALLVAPLLRSGLVWSFAFFPVIVLGLLAEGIARSLDRDNMATAMWRGATTVVLGFVIALVCQIPLVRLTMLKFPELVLTQIVGVILISEYLDLRLLQDWDSRLAGMALPRLFSNEGAYRVAVVRNRLDTAIIGRLGLTAPKRHARRSVQRLVDALRDGGHTVRVLEGDMSLLRELRNFVPPHPVTGQPGGLVLNLTHGIQGKSRHAHVPAMLEMAGVAYTGPTPRGHETVVDQVVSKLLLERAGVPVPAFRVATTPREEITGLSYPLIVKPRHEPSYPLVVATDPKGLADAVRRVIRRYGEEAVVEEQIVGRRISVSILGNETLECFPALELDEETREKICPAHLDEELAERLRHHAEVAFRTCDCRDLARIDFRVTDKGDPYVIEINAIGILEPGGSVACAAAAAGTGFDELVCRLVEVARARYLTGARSSRAAASAPDRVADTAA